MQPFPRIIGFTGQAGSGKTTAALIVLRHYADFSRLSFADPIRSMLLALGLSGSDFSGGAKAAPHPLLCGKSPRQAMQLLGTEWGRTLIDPDIWLGAVNQRLLHVLDAGSRAVFDDVRFDNEARFLREESAGIVIHLENPSAPARMAHASESGISPDLIDHRISAANVDDLKTQLLAYLNGFAAY